MIVVALGGGIGNQLFQYAAARALALRLGVPLGLDRRRFDGRRWPVYALDRFDISSTPVPPKVLPMREGRILGRLLSRFGGSMRVFQEKSLAFDPAVLGLADGTYLRGIFASERYFADQAEAIRRELAFAAPADSRNRDVLTEIGQGIAVSIHVRRGDYVSDPRANRVHGTIESGFYRRAAEYIAAQAMGDLRLFVFSDDPTWAKANLRLDHPMHVVDNNGPEQGVEDLRLMSACKHHILANSTFSWWGAWLNPSPDKIVVAPKPWFRDPTLDESTIVPDGWVRMAVSASA